MAKRMAQKRKDRRDSAPRQEDSIFSSRERKLATASLFGGGRDACATMTFERPDLLILLGLAIVAVATERMRQRVLFYSCSLRIFTAGGGAMIRF